jgi:transposase-like protein
MASREATYQLCRLIELDDSYFGGKKHGGKRGRGSENKSAVLVAVEVPDNKRPKHAWFGQVPSLESDAIEKALRKKIKDLSILKTDAYKGFLFIPNKGYYHYPNDMKDKQSIADHLPWVHILVGNVKNAIRATFHGVRAKHLQRYLGEYSYRFNRRYFESQLFDRLLNACVLTQTITFSEIRQ